MAAKLFQINIVNHIKTKLLICKDYHIQPSEIDRMRYFEFEYLLDNIKEITDKESERNEEQEKKYAEMQHNMNPSNYMKSMNSSMRMPTMPKVSIPKM